MNRHDEDLRAARYRRESLAKARCLWCLVMAVLLPGLIYFACRFGQILAWFMDGNSRAGWAAILWGAPFLIFAALAFWAAVGWPDADEYDPDK